MLQVASKPDSENETVEDDDDPLYCKACRHLVTRGRWRIGVNGAHEHTVFNPAGHVFTIGCFKEAPGVDAAGPPSDDFTWFKGYGWQIALCRGCNVHIGWQYTGSKGPGVFFGLIFAKLTSAPG